MLSCETFAKSSGLLICRFDLSTFHDIQDLQDRRSEYSTVPRRYGAATSTEQLLCERAESTDLHSTGYVVVGNGARAGNDCRFDSLCDAAKYLSGSTAV